MHVNRICIYNTTSYVEGKLDPCIRVAAYTHKEELIEEEVSLWICVDSLLNQCCNEYAEICRILLYHFIIYDTVLYNI